MENKVLFNDIFFLKLLLCQVNYSLLIMFGYWFDFEYNYGLGLMNYDFYNYGLSVVCNQNNMIQYLEWQFNRDGFLGFSVYDNRVMGIFVVFFDSKSIS